MRQVTADAVDTLGHNDTVVINHGTSLPRVLLSTVALAATEHRPGVGILDNDEMTTYSLGGLPAIDEQAVQRDTS